ncbi:dual specificity protein phosphatase 16 [Polymixia lowei]
MSECPTGAGARSGCVCGSGTRTGSGTGVRAAQPIGAEGLVALLEGGLDRVLLIDSRPFVDYNASHILEAVNVNCSKLMKRRLQQDKVQIAELLQHSSKKKLELQGGQEVVVYDQSSSDPAALSSEAFLSVLLAKLERSFPSVHLLSGGFAEFSHLFPGLCEGKSTLVPSCISQPCLPVTNIGPTRILPHLYLGCQRDVLNKDLMQQNDIAYVLNASNTCPKPDFIPESHFLRVPVNDSFCEKILPWLDKSVEFIEKAKASNARVLVHCLAGISRSATIAIAYIMKRMDMSLDEAYRFVKEKRPTISPNFNFLGQLLDFEKKIKSPNGTEAKLKSFHAEQSGEAAAQSEGPDGARETPASQESPVAPGLALLEPLTLPCVLADAPEERLLAQALSGLQLAEGAEDNARLKRSFSLDIKSYGEPGSGAPHRVFAPHAGPGDTTEYFKPSAFKEPASKPCQFSPVEEVSEQSTPEQSPDKEQADGPAPVATTAAASAFPATSGAKLPNAAKPSPPTSHCSHQLHRSGSMEESTHAASFLFGLSRSQQQLARPGASAAGGLKGWHSDILLGPVTVSTSSLAGGWYLSSESTRFYSTSAILSGGGFTAYSCSQGLEAVRRRGRQRSGDRGDSRRSWHEESTFEKQLKRRSCQMEFGDGMSESRSREEMGKVGSQSSFSGSMEIIEVS